MGLKGLAFTIIEQGEPVPATHKAINDWMRNQAGRGAAPQEVGPEPIEPDANDILRARIYGVTPEQIAATRSQSWR